MTGLQVQQLKYQQQQQHIQLQQQQQQQHNNNNDYNRLNKLNHNKFLSAQVEINRF